jgi:selenide,water dikinase
MASQSGASMRFSYDDLPMLPHVRHYIEQGCIPGGARRNAQFLRTHVVLNERLGRVEWEILWDPQTSGGLFAAIDPALWPELAALSLQKDGVQFWCIGEVVEAAPVVLEVV